MTSFDTRLAWAVLLAGLTSGSGCAEDPPRREGPRGGPPPQAIDACAGRMADAYCAFEDGRHSVTGRCQQRVGDWVCVPDREPPGGRDPAEGGMASADRRPPQGEGPPIPPQEAVDACRDLEEGMRCIVATWHGDIGGRCSYSDETLACIPSDPLHQPDHANWTGGAAVR